MSSFASPIRVEGKLIIRLYGEPPFALDASYHFLPQDGALDLHIRLANPMCKFASGEQLREL